MTEPATDLGCVEVPETADWLADFTRQLIEDRLVACGHNFASIRAIYRWDGQGGQSQGGVCCRVCAR